MADVSIICGSASDSAIADKAKKVLDEHKIAWDYQVISAHRDPDKLDAYV
ncbi:MAG TPA: AIR carboxylase family protein, partial [Methanoregula sp.]|nr:AIR carboxylase family protein [Methanoregula sp.]